MTDILRLAYWIFIWTLLQTVRMCTIMCGFRKALHFSPNFLANCFDQRIHASFSIEKRQNFILEFFLKCTKLVIKVMYCIVHQPKLFGEPLIALLKHVNIIYLTKCLFLAFPIVNIFKKISLFWKLARRNRVSNNNN